MINICYFFLVYLLIYIFIFTNLLLFYLWLRGHTMIYDSNNDCARVVEVSFIAWHYCYWFLCAFMDISRESGKGPRWGWGRMVLPFNLYSAKVDLAPWYSAKSRTGLSQLLVPPHLQRLSVGCSRLTQGLSTTFKCSSKVLKKSQSVW